MDQHRVALGREAALEQVGPHGEQRLGHRRRFDHGSARGAPAGTGRRARRNIRHSRRPRPARRPAARRRLRRRRRPARRSRPRLPARGSTARRAAADRGPCRWSMSGRLTPAAATLISTSPAPGRGTGRSTTTSTSGPPGVADRSRASSSAIHVVGPPSPCSIPARALLTCAPATVNAAHHGPGRDSRGRPGDPLALLVKAGPRSAVGRRADARIAALEARDRPGQRNIANAPLTIAQSPTSYSSDERGRIRSRRDARYLRCGTAALDAAALHPDIGANGPTRPLRPQE